MANGFAAAISTLKTKTGLNRCDNQGASKAGALGTIDFRSGRFTFEQFIK